MLPAAAMTTPIYLDHHATTPIDPRVLDAMLPCLRDEFGNPSSRHHAFGRRAAARVEEARERVAQALGSRYTDVVFTSGATEASNLALLGTARANADRLRGVPLSRGWHSPLERAAQTAAIMTERMPPLTSTPSSLLMDCIPSGPTPDMPHAFEPFFGSVTPEQIEAGEGQVADAGAGFLAEGHAPDDIAVITWRGLEHSRVIGEERIAGQRTRRFTGRYTDAGEAIVSDGELQLETLFRFKGQAADCLVITEIDFDAWTEEVRRRLLVGLTRTRLKVALVGSRSANSIVLARLA